VSALTNACTVRRLPRREGVARRVNDHSTVEDLITRALEQLAGRTSGWLSLRFVMQPGIAAVLAIRAGLRDGRTNQPAYLWAVITSAERTHLLREAWKDISRLYAMALAIDALYQLVVFRWLYPVQAVFVAFVLAVVPYVAIRGPVGRLARRRRRV
jgi:hypothetical protein